MEFVEALYSHNWFSFIKDWIFSNKPYKKGYWLDDWNSYSLSIRVVVWMQQFERDEPATAPQIDENKPLVAVPKETYEAMFRHTHGTPSIAQSPVDTALVDAATVVLDKRTEDAMKSKADDLLGTINTGEAARPLQKSEALNAPNSSVDVAPTAPPTPALPEDDLEF